MTLQELIKRLQTEIGDTDITDQRITDDEYAVILSKSATEYSRIKSYLKFDETNIYDMTKTVYPVPIDSLKVKKVLLKKYNYSLPFLDNLDQVILLQLPDLAPDTLQITYSKYFDVTEIMDKEINLFIMYSEALCYKLLSSKAAELIKFGTGEKMVDESLISDKYLKLYMATEKAFRAKAIRAYGNRADTPKEELDYRLQYPIPGENL